MQAQVGLALADLEQADLRQRRLLALHLNAQRLHRQRVAELVEGLQQRVQQGQDQHQETKSQQRGDAAEHQRRPAEEADEPELILDQQVAHMAVTPQKG